MIFDQGDSKTVDEGMDSLPEEASDSSQSSEEKIEKNSPPIVATAATIGGLALAIGGAFLLQRLQKQREEKSLASSPFQAYDPQAENEITETEVEDLISSDPELSNLIREQRELQKLSLWKNYIALEHDAANTIISNIGKSY